MNTKAQSIGKALLGIALVIVIFSAGFYFSGPKIIERTFMGNKKMRRL